MNCGIAQVDEGKRVTGAVVDLGAQPEATPDTSTKRHNGDFPWDKFDTKAYLAHNYTHVREEDREIVGAVGDFFANACQERSGLRGIDIGTGANLYPALAMLPFCDDITLFEYSKSNVDWLVDQNGRDWPSWHSAWHGFWEVLCDNPAYKAATEPDMGALLAARTSVVKGSVFGLRPERPYDIGTMFFVAESITPERAEYADAVDHFLAALAPGAPFAIALMEHSSGYRVGDNLFPATDIGDQDVRQFLESRTAQVVVKQVGPGTDPVREGYTGMIIACGRAGAATG